MGFSCYACSEPFEEVVPPPASHKGAGDGQKDVKIRPVSAISKCGHLFHADCLKKALEVQPGNAWAPKSCPVCRQVINMSDIIRVHANPFDPKSSQRPRIEEIKMQYRKLREEFQAERNNADMMRKQIREKNSEMELLMRRDEDLSAAVDRLLLLTRNQKEDLDRASAEKNKLKNIIVNLTEKFACPDLNGRPDFYGSSILHSMNGANGNVCRLEYTEELQRNAIEDSKSLMSSNMMNGCLPKPLHLHPPGFLFPPMWKQEQNNNMETRSECQDSVESQTASLSPELMKPQDIFIGSSIFDSGNGKQNIMLLTENSQHERSTAYAMQNVQARNYDTNNNNSSVTRNVLEELGLPLGKKDDISRKENAAPVSVTCAPYSSPNLLTSKNGTTNSSSSAAATAKIENTKAVEEQDYDDDAEDDPVDKWHEKKARRRGSSRSSGGTGKGGRSNGKYDSVADKKLLYGSFSCPTCKAKWGSSQSVLNTPQTCRYCSTVVHPYSQGPILSRKQLELSKHASNNTTTDSGDKKK